MEAKGKLNQIIFIGLLVMFSSQIYIKLFVNYFNISFGIIVLIILIYMMEIQNKLIVAITSSIFVYVIRIVVYFLENSGLYFGFKSGVLNHFPEFIFYLVYISIYFIITRKNNNLNILLFNLIVCDFFANSVEMYIRHTLYSEKFNLYIIVGIMCVAFLRSTLIWIMINLMIRYNTSLLKKEHTERYMKLLAVTSRLKSEVYLMEKSMESIENVMGKSYRLYTYVSEKKLDENLETEAIDITKDIHEIKKEFNLIVRGVNELTNSKELKDNMNYYEILDILRHMINIKIKNTNINFNIQRGENFNTIHHYYIISIFRNLIMNSIDALENNENREISLIHGEMKKDDIIGHYFKIKDNGQGMDEEDKKYVFNPGFSTKINFETGDVNRGLGLSIVKDIVENKLKGFIRLNSTKGKGTEFMIFIPKDTLEGERI